MINEDVSAISFSQGYSTHNFLLYKINCYRSFSLARCMVQQFIPTIFPLNNWMLLGCMPLRYSTPREEESVHIEQVTFHFLNNAYLYKICISLQNDKIKAHKIKAPCPCLHCFSFISSFFMTAYATSKFLGTIFQIILDI